MKLKKVLSGLMAVVMAVTSSAVFPCTVSATNLTVTGSTIPVTENAITISNTIENGEVEASPETAVAGTEITLTATPAEGYELDAYTVKDASDNTVTVTDGKFTMPASAVTVSATFKKVPTDPVQVAYDAIVAYLKTVTFDNDFHATNQAKAIEALVKEKAPDARVDSSFIVNVATYTDAGSVKGTILIKADDSEPKTITVDEVIAVLPKTDEILLIEEAVTATEAAIKAIETADGITEAVVKKAIANDDITVIVMSEETKAPTTTATGVQTVTIILFLNKEFAATVTKTFDIDIAASNYTDPVNTTIPENKIVTQKTAVADGVYNQRFIEKVKASELFDATKIIFTVSNGTKTVTYESTKCYSSLNVNGGSISAGDDYVFLGLTIKDIPEDITVTIKGIEIVY